MAKYSLLRLRASNSEAQPVTEVNIIPVIDVSLVLLVILFVSAPLLSYPNLPVELPRAVIPGSQEKTVTITYTKRDELAVGSRMTDWDALPAAIQEAVQSSQDVVVVFRVDKTVPYRIVERLISTAQQAGVKKTALAIEPPK